MEGTGPGADGSTELVLPRPAEAGPAAGGATGEVPPAGVGPSGGTSTAAVPVSTSGVLDPVTAAPTRPTTSEILCWVPLGSLPARVMRIPAESIEVGVSRAGRNSTVMPAWARTPISWARSAVGGAWSPTLNPLSVRATWTPATVNDATVNDDALAGACPGAWVRLALARDWPRASGPVVNPSKREWASAVRTPVPESTRTAAAARDDRTDPSLPDGPPEPASPVECVWSLSALAWNGPIVVSVDGFTGWLLLA